MGLLPETARITGAIHFQGQDLLRLSKKQMRQHRGPDVAMVFQDPARSLNPTMRIGTQIAEALRAHDRLSGREVRERVIELLSRVRLSEPARRYAQYPHQLSGGMRQRVMLAIALACGPKLLIADEATTALDVTTQAQIMDLLMDLKTDYGMAVIMISHNLALAASYADQVVVMYAGQPVERAPTVELFAGVRMPYTDALLKAIPRLSEGTDHRVQATAGSTVSLAHPKAGCVFAPRCPVAREDCREVAPPYKEHEPGHWWACFYPLGDPAPLSRPTRDLAAGHTEGSPDYDCSISL